MLELKCLTLCDALYIIHSILMQSLAVKDKSYLIGAADAKGYFLIPYCLIQSYFKSWRARYLNVGHLGATE